MAMLNKKQASEYLGINQYAFARIVKDGSGPRGVGAGKRIFFGTNVLDDWREKNQEFLESLINARWKNVIESNPELINGPIVREIVGARDNVSIFAMIESGEFPKETHRAGANVFWEKKDVISWLEGEKKKIQDKIEKLTAMNGHDEEKAKTQASGGNKKNRGLRFAKSYGR